MPTISDKELERYKRIEDLLKNAKSVIEMFDANRCSYREFCAEIETVLNPISSRPTADELLGWDRVGVAIKVLKALRDEYEQNGIITKAQNILRDWIEEYKAER